MTDWILLISALLTAIISGSLGMGGGMLLLAVMAQYFPLATLIPLHGLIQLSSNSSRAIFSFKSIMPKLVWPYAIGALFGAAIGSQVVLKIPGPEYKISLGTFIIIVTLIGTPAPLFRLKARWPMKWPLIGAISTFLGMFVGATGPLIAPFYLSEKLNKEQLIATKASCQVFSHLLKVSAFFAVGFWVGPHLRILLGMIAMVILGNWIGKVILHRIPEKVFFSIFYLLIVTLSLRMIIQGVLAKVQ